MRHNILNIVANVVAGGEIFMSRKAEVDICYQGQLHQIDLDTLVITLLHFSEITKAIVKEIAPNEQIRIKINATEKGSFNIKLELVREILGLFKSDGFSSAYMLLMSIVGIFQLKGFLKGRKPDKTIKSNDDIIILKDNAQMVIAEKVFNIYSKNSEVNKHIEEWFDRLTDVTEIEGLLIDAKKAGIFEVQQNDFSSLAQENELLKEDEEIVVINTELSIVKIVFDRKRKWEFIFQGNKISALINHEQFWRSVESQSVRFAKGDVLVVQLEITKVFDQELNCHINKSYKVINVFEHRITSQTPQQLEFPLED